MALNNIKRRLTEERVRDEEERKKAQDQNRIYEQDNYREAQERLKSVLPYLIQLEGFFWECASDFSKLSQLPIKRRNRSLLYPLTSTPTLNNPVLSVCFQPPPKIESNCIYLRADSQLHFHASCSQSVSRYSPNGRVFGVVSSSFLAQYCDIQYTRDWLELQFENYYREVEILKK